MPLTKDRPDVTAAQLNALWATLISRVAPALPMGIRDPNGDGSLVFDSTDLDESDPEARSVVDPIDLVGALVSKGSAFGGATWLATVLANPSAGRRVEVRESYSQTGATAARDQLPPAFASADVLIDGLAGLTISVERVVSTAAGGWGLDSSIGNVETFAGSGYAAWDPGEVGQIASVEQFAGVGYAAWRAGAVYQIAGAETAWSGFPAAAVPVDPSGTGCIAQVDLTEQVDGVETSFSLPAYEAGSLRVYLNGQRLSGSMITETSSTSFSIAETVPEIGDALVADYCACAC